MGAIDLTFKGFRYKWNKKLKGNKIRQLITSLIIAMNCYTRDDDSDDSY